MNAYGHTVLVPSHALQSLIRRAHTAHAAAGGGGLALLAQPPPEAAWDVVRGNAANAAATWREHRFRRAVNDRPEFDAATAVVGPSGDDLPPIRPLLGASAVARAAWPRDVSRLRSAPAALRMQGAKEMRGTPDAPAQVPNATKRAAEAASGTAAPAWCAPPPPPAGNPEWADSPGEEAMARAAAAARTAEAAERDPPRAVYVTAGGAVGLAEARRLPRGVAALLRGSPALRPAAAGPAAHAPREGDTGQDCAGEQESAPAGAQMEIAKHRDGGLVRRPWADHWAALWAVHHQYGHPSTAGVERLRASEVPHSHLCE